MQATTSRQRFDPRPAAVGALVVATFAAGLALGMLITPSVPAIAPSVSIPVGDHGYDALEATRADRGLSIPVGDHGYDALEATRADRGLPSIAGDRSYDSVEETRADRGLD